MVQEYKRYAATFKIQITVPILCLSMENARGIAEYIVKDGFFNKEIPMDSDIDQVFLCGVLEEE